MNRRLFLSALLSPALSGLDFGPAAAAEEAGFGEWLKALRAEATQRGFSARTLDDAFTGIAVIPRVVELDRQQPEVTLTFDAYIARVVNDARAESGRQRVRDNRELLDRVAGTYNVQPRFIVALWAIETDFGRLTGNFPIVSALATLAFEGRRAAFFRDELFNALKILERTGIRAQDLRGSWAGAMGQSQFMPSSYLAYAVDFDGDGKPDIWNSRADVFASIANYLSKVGWRMEETWGREVKAPPNLDRALVSNPRLNVPAKSLAEWESLGIQRSDGGPLPRRDLTAWLIQPAGADGPSFLVYQNYSALLRWNRSLYFATAVGYLADRIGAG
jgi:membrane-bound lytic murein transglycosylase B